MIWLHPLSSLPSVSSTGPHRNTEKEKQLADGRGGSSRIERRRESLVLYNSFNTLWIEGDSKSNLYGEQATAVFFLGMGEGKMTASPMAFLILTRVHKITNVPLFKKLF